ncbi:MAE_28990/MAE_18760 family HEPN-like nuclease [Cronobacter dublinensis]|uniref:MAE_28990/MAE_18760 family HEPN-like nuclease n=1 Tax=Cronobacter dublinensis TaxID=413497 RepID=UPI00376FEE09
MEIRTVTQLSRELTNELSWRKMEIIHLRLQAVDKNGSLQNTLIRAGVSMSYSHWEGFIKNSTEYFLQFLNFQRLNVNLLKLVYASHHFKNEINSFSQTKDVSSVIRFLEAIFTKSEIVAKIKHENYVDTESNLSSTVFDNIAKSIGINTNFYLDYYPYIDESLVNKRNGIAHGEKLSMNYKMLEELTDTVITLMENYKTDIENIAIQQSYLK